MKEISQKDKNEKEIEYKIYADWIYIKKNKKKLSLLVWISKRKN